MALSQTELIRSDDDPSVPSRPAASPGSTAPRRARRSLGPRLLPYWMLAPAVIVLALVLGYPLVRLGIMSLQEFGLRQQFGARPPFVGIENFRTIFTDSYFWDVLWRTVIFCAVNVALTMSLGMAIAVLLGRLGRWMKLAVGTSLLLAWAMPALTATVVWQWLFDTQYGFFNWVLTSLGADSYQGHSWLSAPISFFSVATIIVVWMGVPFVAFTLHAGLTQVPSEVLEAAEMDGAGGWQRFRLVSFPMVKPIVMILTALSVLWDFRVFTQIYVLQRAGGINRETNLLGVYAYRISTGENRFDVGAAVALVMVTLTILLTLVYLRQMMRQDEAI